MTERRPPGVNRAYVLGSPIAHTLSPALHRAAYAALGLTDWAYAAHEVDESGFAAVVAGLGPDVRGLSLTMPLKEVAFDVASTVTAQARLAGAINTLIRRADGGWDGRNTDIAGIIGALGGGDVASGASGSQGVILGAGATARSALIALAALGATSVSIAARDPEKARASLAELGATLDVELRFTSLARWWEDVAVEETGLVVSTLPPAGAATAAAELSGRAGPATAAEVSGGAGPVSAAEPVDETALDSAGTGTAGEPELAGVRLLDVVYAGWPTPLARAAAACGAEVVGGLDMLVHQAVEQVELMTGRRPDPRVLLAAGRAELANRA